MYLLDTNHCSGAILRNPTILNHLKSIEQEVVGTCVIVQGELIDMAERSQRSQNNLELVQNFLQGIYIYDVDRETANVYGWIKAAIFKQFAPKEKSKRRKTKMFNLGFDENDLWITAIALQHELIIISSDSDFSRIQTVVSALKIESWM